MHSQELHFYSLIFFGLFVASVIVINKLKLSFINPFSIFFLPSFAYLSISFLGLVRFMTPFKPLTWLVILASWMAFILAFATNEALATSRYPSKSSTPDTSQAFENYNWKGHLIFTWGVFSISCLSFMFIYTDLHSTILFSGRSGELLHHGDLFSGPYPIFYFHTAAIAPISLFSVACIKSWNSNNKLRLIAIFSTIFSIILTFLFLPTKGLTMQIILFFIGLRVFAGFKIKLLHIFIAPLFAFIVFLSIVYFQSGLFISQFMLPYEYIANNFWNLDYALNTTDNGIPEHPQFILSALNGLLYLLPTWIVVLNSYGIDTLYNESIVKTNGLNTVSFHWHLYKDMGMFSLILGSYILGLILSWIWKCILHQPKPFHIILYNTLLFCVIQTSAGGQWTYPTIMLWIIINSICALLYSPKEKNSQTSTNK